jgi:predicted TIM-barrel fold metal-dependent hydrolase
MTTENRRIDVHYHIIPKPYVEALAGEGITGSAWVKFPKWTPEMALRHMDRFGIQTAITSLSTPGVWFEDRTLARRLSRLCNDFQAQMKSDHPDRFGAFAFLPLPDMDGALPELEYALDHLGHDGVALLSDVEGRYLGDPAYEELFAELDRRSAVVFIHPHTDPRRKPRYEFLFPLLEWPVHTTRAVMDLLYSGRLARYPKIRYILAHGGGAVPYLAHRMAKGSLGGGDEQGEGKGSRGRSGSAEGQRGGDSSGNEGEVQARLNLLRGLYYDAAAPGEGHFASITELAGPGRILFGTDGGWTQPLEMSLKIKSFLACDGLTAADRDAIQHENAAALFPQLRSRIRGTVDARA